MSARALVLMAVGFGLAAGYLASDTGISSRLTLAAGAQLTLLLRSMAVLKAFMATGLVGGVLWRLGSGVTAAWLSAYAVAAAAMGAGVCMIWLLARLGLGAALLHGGLLASILLFWRDPVVGARLSKLVAERRAAIARQT